jgi:peptidoglycan/LPS O-acetylase OafA/YrhL
MKFLGIDVQNRIFGLDLLRFFAISFVMLGHSKILVPENYDPYIGKLILDGVSIFFVLSGFLIGQILIKQINAGKTNFQSLMNFWSRRWLRTLPAYFIVLASLLLFTFYLKPTRFPDTWYKYFIFSQNLFTKQPGFFSESWSLSVEEWFYLIIPLILFSLLFFFPKNKKKVILITIFGTIISVLVYRYFFYYSLLEINAKNFNLDMLTQVFTRLDGIMLGVLGAFLSIYYLELWAKLNKFILVAAMFITLYLLKQFGGGNQDAFYCIFIPLLKSIAVFFMLPFLSKFRVKKANLLVKSITFISITSYSMYLVNRTIVIDIIFKYFLHDNLLKKHVFGSYWILEYIGFWLISILLAFLMYKLIENPFLKLRKKSVS